jgi:hypothetical protein
MTDIACTISSVAPRKYNILLIVLLIVPELNLYVWLPLFDGGRRFYEKMFLTVKKTPKGITNISTVVRSEQSLQELRSEICLCTTEDVQGLVGMSCI